MRGYVSWSGLDWDELSRCAWSGEFNLQSIDILRILREKRVRELRESLASDLLIVRLAGERPDHVMESMRDLAGARDWAHRRAQIVLRSQDSHVNAHFEKRVEHLVDWWALAHPEDAVDLDVSKILKTPVNLEGMSREEALSLSEVEAFSPQFDASSCFKLYAGAPRNLLALRVSQDLTRRGIYHFIGSCSGMRKDSWPGEMFSTLLATRVGLNLAFSRDFNIRNLETGLIGLPTVTTSEARREPSPGLCHLTYSEPNPTQIVDKIEELLQDEKPPKPASRRQVALNHLSNDRLYQVIKEVLGIEATVRKDQGIPPVRLSCEQSFPPSEKQHSQLDYWLMSMRWLSRAKQQLKRRAHWRAT